MGRPRGLRLLLMTQTPAPSGDCKEPDKCCWKHKQYTGHIIYPFASDCVCHSLHLRSVNHCNCNSR